MHPFLSGDSTKIFAEEYSRAKAAEQRNKARPQPRRNRNRDMEIMQWQMRVLYSENDEQNLRNTFVTGQCYCSISPIETLQSIRLRDMMVPKLHSGHYLICRTLGKIVVRVGSHVLVEDLNGDVEDLSLYNFRYDLNDTSWLPTGSIMVIKEPYLKYASTGDNTLIRVDSPSDVEVVDEADYKRLECIGALKWYKKERMDFNQLKSAGNSEYGRKNYETALKYYNRALLVDPDSAVIHLNKAAALLALERFYEAYNEAKIAFEGDANPEKSLYRLGMAAYGMRRWEKAVGHFKELLNRSPNHRDAKLELQRTMARLNESRTGRYNIRDLYDKAIKGNQRRLDIADYIGPVQVADVPGKGKGLVATKDIDKGTLLSASKAFAVSFDEDHHGDVYSANMILNRIDPKTHLLNMIKTTEHLQKNPQLATELYSLYAGNMQRDQAIPSGIIDTARIQNICSYNSYGISNEMDMITAEENKMDTPSGLWILPAFINHSCLENANRTFYGDFMMLFAVQDIAKGEEITVPYANPFGSYEKRNEKFEKHYGFECDCRLCKLDRADLEFSAKREHLVDECNKLIEYSDQVGSASQQTVSRLIALIKQIRQTYKNRSEYRLYLFTPLSMLGTLYGAKGDYRKGLKCYEEALECLGSGLRHIHGPIALILLATDYLKLGKHDKAKEFVRQAVDIYRDKMGADVELFKEYFPGLPDILY